jgi:hypothetical protein
VICDRILNLCAMSDHKPIPPSCRWAAPLPAPLIPI